MSVFDEIILYSIGKENANIDDIFLFMKKTMKVLMKDEKFRVTIDLLLFKTELTEELEVIDNEIILWTNMLIDKISHIIENDRQKTAIKTELTSKEIAVSIMVMHRGLGFMFIMNNEIFPHTSSCNKIIENFLENIIKRDKNEK